MRKKMEVHKTYEDIRRNRNGQIWTLQLEGFDYATATEKADKEIETAKEAAKMEALREFDRMSKMKR
jgi:hypothetical protein